MKGMKRLQKLLKDMDVPKLRRTDVRWLARNLPIRNHSHPKFQEAMDTIKNLLKKPPTEDSLYPQYVQAAAGKESPGFDIMQRFQKGKPTTAYPGGFDILKRWQREQENHQDRKPGYETGGFDIMKKVVKNPVKVKKAVEQIDKLATEIEPHNPGIALFLDQISDQMEREAGLRDFGKKVKEKVKGWKDKLVGIVKNNKDLLVKKMAGAVKVLAGKVFNAIASKYGVAVKLAKMIINKSNISPDKKKDIELALSSKDPVAAVKKLNGMLSKEKLSPEEEKKGLAIAKNALGQVRTASEDDCEEIFYKMVEAGVFDKISTPTVLILVVLIIIAYSAFSPVFAAGGWESVPIIENLKEVAHNVSTWQDLADKVSNLGSIPRFVNTAFVQGLGSDGDVLSNSLTLVVEQDKNILKDLFIQGATKAEVVQQLGEQLKDMPDLLK